MFTCMLEAKYGKVDEPQRRSRKNGRAQFEVREKSSANVVMGIAKVCIEKKI